MGDSESAKRGLAAGVALAIICVSPSVFGCSPPWAGGFLAAVLCILAAVHILASVINGKEWFPLPAGIRWMALGLAAWLVVAVMYDWAMGTAGGRVPAVSGRKLFFAASYLGAAILGAAYCSSAGRRLEVVKVVALAGVALAVTVLAEYSGWDIRVFWGAAPSRWERLRLSGIYVNPNRFAVLMTICWSCALGGLFDFISGRRNRPGRRVWVAIFIVSAIAAGTCVGLTLSRLTIAAAGIAVFIAVSAYIHRRMAGEWNAAAEEAAVVPRIEKLRTAALAAMPIAAMAGWGVWVLASGESHLRERFADMTGRAPSVSNRIAVMTASLPLLGANPLFGCGLGMFESLFAGIQPFDLSGRWREVHCDWLQIAIEAGIPALALAAAAAVIWAKTCLEGAFEPAEHDRPRPWLVLFPAAGILAALICSLLDFPLREPATAALVFFLAGGMSRRFYAEHAEGGAGAKGAIGFAAAWAVVLFLSFGAFTALREGIAWSFSPWLGRIFCPPPDVSQLESWRRAVAIDGGNPEILYRLASSAAAPGSSGARDLRLAREKVREAAALQPYDYRFAALEAGIAEETGDRAAAEELWERAAELAPCYPHVRFRCAMFHLKIAGERSGIEEGWISLDVENAMRHFRALVAVETNATERAISELDRAGCADMEIAELWAGDDVPARLARARFYISRGRYERARREMPHESDVGVEHMRWYHALSGRLALENGGSEECAWRWSAAMDGASVRDGGWKVCEWIAGCAGGIDTEVIEAVSELLGEKLRRYPPVAVAFSRRLVEGGRWFAADRILEALAGTSPDACSLWAELALRLGDIESAERRAAMVRRIAMDSMRWLSWYDRFMERVARERLARQRGGEIRKR